MSGHGDGADRPGLPREHKGHDVVQPLRGRPFAIISAISPLRAGPHPRKDGGLVDGVTVDPYDATPLLDDLRAILLHAVEPGGLYAGRDIKKRLAGRQRHDGHGGVAEIERYSQLRQRRRPALGIERAIVDRPYQPRQHVGSDGPRHRGSLLPIGRAPKVTQDRQPVKSPDLSLADPQIRPLGALQANTRNNARLHRLVDFQRIVPP